MARKSRKHPAPKLTSSRDTVGYIRLSVRNSNPAGSIENQKHFILQMHSTNSGFKSSQLKLLILRSVTQQHGQMQ